PPEQARTEPVDRRADVWAVGAVLRLLATGTLPHDAPSPTQRLYMLTLGQEPDPYPDDTPPWLEEICRRPLAVDAGGRFATGDELARALTVAAEANSGIATPAEVAAYVRPYLRKGRPSAADASESVTRLIRASHPSVTDVSLHDVIPPEVVAPPRV